MPFYILQVDTHAYMTTTNSTRVPEMTWIHSCVTIDSILNHLTVVVNGKMLEDKVFAIPAGAQPPSSLTEKLFIFKAHWGFWYQSKNKVSNLNIFSKRMTLPEMVSRTAGDDCGKADGDYLAWESAEWVLKGKASFGEVTVEDLCRKESRIQVFTSPIGQLDECKNLCEKMQNGRMAAMRSTREIDDHLSRVDEILFPNGEPSRAGVITPATWAPIHKAINGSWQDVYNNNPVTGITWITGHPTPATLDRCAIYIVPWKGLGSFTCSVDIKVNLRYCPCYFPEGPHLKLRGLCPDSHIDQAYLARNDPVTGFLYFYGTHKTIARFDGKRWKMMTAFFNTSALTDAKADTFILGKHSWNISGDSEECHSGKPYTRKLKLTGCAEGDFTCNDGQCVKMEERCNQVPDCRDESDEDGCKLILLKNSYNKDIPPIEKRKIHSIHLQFQISLQWNENRVQYLNLKNETSLNALTDYYIRTIWLPLIV